MKTVFAGLPFYDDIEKTDRNRTRARIPFHCPRFQLPPFLINAESDTPGVVSRVDLMDCSGGLTEITTYFVAVPALYTSIADHYFQYKGVVLKQALPMGQYRIKVTTANGFIYYSESLVISDIYPNLITGWTNSNYETFTSSGVAITSAINTAGDGLCYADIGVVRKGEAITVRFNFTLNSGDVPTIYISSTSLGGTLSNTVAAVAGVNAISLVPTQSLTDARIRFVNNTNANWSTSQVFVYRPYSSRFTRLDFYNSKDLGDILYQDSWFQTLWLECRLNYPLSETVEVGEEKDGIFLAEKIVTKYIYRIMTFVSRALHNVLMRLPQHSSITITDEVGNTYTPSVGNIQISAMEWSSFETGKMVISFNDGDNSAFNWTYDMMSMPTI